MAVSSSKLNGLRRTGVFAVSSLMPCPMLPAVDERNAACGERVGYLEAIVAIQVHVQHRRVEDMLCKEDKGLPIVPTAVADAHPRSASMSSIIMRASISSSTTKPRREFQLCTQFWSFAAYLPNSKSGQSLGGNVGPRGTPVIPQRGSAVVVDIHTEIPNGADLKDLWLALLSRNARFLGATFADRPPQCDVAAEFPPNAASSPYGMTRTRGRRQLTDVRLTLARVG